MLISDLLLEESFRYKKETNRIPYSVRMSFKTYNTILEEVGLYLSMKDKDEISCSKKFASLNIKVDNTLRINEFKFKGAPSPVGDYFNILKNIGGINV